MLEDGLPDPDEDTHARLLEDPGCAPHILSAVVALLIGSTDAATAAGILREWADAIQRNHPAGRQ